MSFVVEAVAHHGITVTDLEQSVAFFEGVLGFKSTAPGRIGGEFASQVTGVPGADISIAFVKAPGLNIELLQYHAPPDRVRVKPRACDVGSVHLALYVDDVAAAIAAVVPAGWLPLGEPQTIEKGPRAGGRAMYVRDEDGTTIEFIERPKRPSDTA
jgi:catechol 2,3-dioxygenase-like lactoylglutathione lyase family enzyme